MTVNGTTYWVYRYEGALNDIENAVVLFCWPRDAFQNPKALRAFLSTDVSLETEVILTTIAIVGPSRFFSDKQRGILILKDIKSDLFEPLKDYGYCYLLRTYIAQFV